jgi:general secretion pathway protein A
MREALVELTPADTGGRSSFLTYEPYYGLTEKPFSLSPDPRFLYRSPAHAPMFDELRAGIRRREGIIILTGEPGTGKTTLCRSVLAALDRKTFCAFVADPFVSREDLLKMLLIEFGVTSIDDVKSGRLHSATRSELSYPLYEFLRSLVPLQAYAVLIIDEAQNLSAQLLEEVRILADLEGPEKLLQLVLVGQPELRGKMKDPTIRQVDQRISVRCSLEPLERSALPAYIAHRLTVAGSGSDRVEFAAESINLLYTASNGNPRVINLIADKALYHGYLARTWIITPALVIAALRDLGYAEPVPVADVSAPVAEPERRTAQPLSPELFPPEQSAPARFLPDVKDIGPRFLLDEVREQAVIDPSGTQRTRRRFRLVALLATAGLVLAASGRGINEWELRRRSQLVSLPAVPAPPSPPVSAAAAPVIPPADFFASVPR